MTTGDEELAYGTNGFLFASGSRLKLYLFQPQLYHDDLLGYCSACE